MINKKPLYTVLSTFSMLKAALGKLYQSEPDGRVKERLLAILLLDEGNPYSYSSEGEGNSSNTLLEAIASLKT